MTKEELLEYLECEIETLGNDSLQEVLDELVHDVLSKQASGINNQGYPEQLSFLLESGFSLEELKKELGLTYSGDGGPPYDAATATGMYDRND